MLSSNISIRFVLKPNFRVYHPSRRTYWFASKDVQVPSSFLNHPSKEEIFISYIFQVLRDWREALIKEAGTPVKEVKRLSIVSESARTPIHSGSFSSYLDSFLRISL
jgi:hypothetical protein